MAIFSSGDVLSLRVKGKSYLMRARIPEMAEEGEWNDKHEESYKISFSEMASYEARTGRRVARGMHVTARVNNTPGSFENRGVLSELCDEDGERICTLSI